MIITWELIVLRVYGKFRLNLVAVTQSELTNITVFVSVMEVMHLVQVLYLSIILGIRVYM
jgi:hypothetical protein